jgi:hypothetical protein
VWAWSKVTTTHGDGGGIGCDVGVALGGGDDDSMGWWRGGGLSHAHAWAFISILVSMATLSGTINKAFTFYGFHLAIKNKPLY